MINYKLFLLCILLSLSILACQEESNGIAGEKTRGTPPQETQVIVKTTNEDVNGNSKTVNTATATPTVTPSATATNTPTPTNTPLPTERLMAANQAFHNGLYDKAWVLFDSLVNDAQADSFERETAFYWRGRTELALGNYLPAQLSFLALLEVYPDGTFSRAARFNQALALEHLGLYTQTIQVYQAALLPDDPIAAYIYERMADFALESEVFGGAVKWYKEALQETDEVSFKVHLQEGLAEAYIGLQAYELAQLEYESILNVARIPAYRAKIIRLQGEAYQKASDLEAAQGMYQSVLNQYPTTYDAYLALLNMVEAEMTVDEFERGYVDYYGGNAYHPAIEAFERYLADAPDDRVDEVHWLLALSWRAVGAYPEALAEFDLLIKTYPESEFWAEAYLQRARTLGWQGNVTEAVLSYRRFASENPTHDLAGEALWRAALLMFETDDFEASASAFKQLVLDYPLNKYSDDALYKAALANYIIENYAEAAQIWADLLSAYPASEFGQAASYWQAKALLKAGEQDQAMLLLEQLSQQSAGYYTLRARDLLNGQLSEPRVPLIVTSPTPGEQAEAETWLATWLGLSQSTNFSNLDRQIQGDPAFIRGEALWVIGLKEEALAEYEKVKNNWSDNPLALYQLALAFKERGAYRLSMLCADALIGQAPASEQGAVPKFIKRLVYPVYYADVVMPKADLFGLDAAVVFAITRQESFFEADATSHAGARGLMQVMPATGADIASRRNIANYSDALLWQPQFNIDFGMWYIDSMLNYFDGNEFAALAAYNAGPGRVERWLAEVDDVDLFVSLMPLNEPNVYIKKVYQNLAAYRAIYGEQK